MFRVIFLFVFATSYLFSAILDEIEKSGVFKVCIWPDYFAISYLDPRTQKLSGIDVELAKHLADFLDSELEFVSSSFATLIEDVDSKKCHIAMFGIGVTPNRLEKLRFTSPHLASDIYAITTKSNKKVNSWSDIDKKGTIVAVAKGTLHEPVMRERLKNATLVVLDSPKAREQEVRSGRADLFMTDFPFGKRVIETTEWAKLIVPNEEFHITNYAWAMRYGDDDFYNRVEEFMQLIKKDGRLLQASKNSGLFPIVLLK